MQEGMRQALHDFGAKAEVAVMVEKKVSYHNGSKSASNGGEHIRWRIFSGQEEKSILIFCTSEYHECTWAVPMGYKWCENLPWE